MTAEEICIWQKINKVNAIMQRQDPRFLTIQLMAYRYFYLQKLHLKLIHEWCKKSS
jgi:hypothetical protein